MVARPSEDEFHAQLRTEGVEITTHAVDQPPLWELASKWYDIAANEAVYDGTRHGYRECANQLEDLLTERGVGAQRVAEIIDQHHQADEYGYSIEECRCGDDRDGTETWAAHLALVLTTDLGLT